LFAKAPLVYQLVGVFRLAGRTLRLRIFMVLGVRPVTNRRGVRDGPEQDKSPHNKDNVNDGRKLSLQLFLCVFY
jgi:hypothetical protein